MRFAFLLHMVKAVHRSLAWVCDGPIVQAVVGTAWGQVVRLVGAIAGTAVVVYVGMKKVPPEQGEKKPQEMKRLVFQKVEKHLPVRATV